MRYAVVIRHVDEVSGPGYHAQVTGRIQRIWFRWWELRSLWHCYRSARRLYRPSSVSLERW